MNPTRQDATFADARDPVTQARILIVDDHELTITTIETILRQDGFRHFKSTTDPREAARLCDEFRPDLLLLDILMPELDGFAVMRSLRAREIDDYLPIRIVTSESDQATKLKALQSGATDFASKPLDAAELICRVRNILRMRMLQNDLRRSNRNLEVQVRRRTKRLEAAIGLLRHAEAKLGEALADSQARSKGKTDMLATVSHELRTPLTAIMGFAELLRDEPLGPLKKDKRRGYAADIHVAASHALGVVNDILDLSKVEAGEIDIELEDTEVTKTIIGTVKMLSGIATKADVALSVDIPGDFPVLRTDEKRLRQVLVNVVTNAIKFTPSGGSVTVRARHNPEDGALIMVVTDNGVGIEKKDLEKVMRAYGRAGRPVHDVQNSTGLGLPLTRKLVDALGGGLEILDRPEPLAWRGVAIDGGNVKWPCAPNEGVAGETTNPNEIWDGQSRIVVDPGDMPGRGDGAMVFGIRGRPDTCARIWPGRGAGVVADEQRAGGLRCRHPDPTSVSMIVLRFITGACMAGVYPVGMKLASTWAKGDLGLIIGLMVGSLTLGSASPHLFNAFGGLDWRLTIAVASAVAAGAAALINLFALGPRHTAAPPYDSRAALTAWTNRGLRLANLGYLGLMWELYAMWAWLGVFLDASFHLRPGGDDAAMWARFATFAAMGLGGAAGCMAMAGGYLADRWGRTTLTRSAMIISGACALVVGFLFGGNPALLVTVCMIWGITVVADSAQFSASVTELSEPGRIGTMLTTQTCGGFLLTLVTIHLLPPVVDAVGWRYAFAVLALGPVIGVAAMLRLRSLPETARLAGGRR